MFCPFIWRKASSIPLKNTQHHQNFHPSVACFLVDCSAKVVLLINIQTNKSSKKTLSLLKLSWSARDSLVLLETFWVHPVLSYPRISLFDEGSLCLPQTLLVCQRLSVHLSLPPSVQETLGLPETLSVRLRFFWSVQDSPGLCETF